MFILFYLQVVLVLVVGVVVVVLSPHMGIGGRLILIHRIRGINAIMVVISFFAMGFSHGELDGWMDGWMGGVWGPPWRP